METLSGQKGHGEVSFGRLIYSLRAAVSSSLKQRFPESPQGAVLSMNPDDACGEHLVAGV